MTDAARTFLANEIAATQRIATTPTTTQYGIDLVCVADVDARLTETRDDTVESLAQDLYHRVTTPRGGIIDDPDFGEDVTTFLSGNAQPTDLVSIEGRLASECRKDDRVDRVVVSVKAPAPKTLDVEIVVTPRNPALVTFTLIIPVADGLATLEAILKGT